MNRLEMAEEIAKWVPTLAEDYKDEWKRLEQLRARFVADYPPADIPALTLDDYVIGKGKGNKSFCYCIEREMDNLGMIRGANSFKFGVYYGHTKKDATVKYRCARRWGATVDEAFTAIKQAIVNLLNAAKAGDDKAIEANRLSALFKGKILFLYYPEQFAPIYSEIHLRHFIAELDLAGPFHTGTEMQRALMDYRATWPELKAHTAALYMDFLYTVFGKPKVTKKGNTKQGHALLLDEALEGASFISAMPAVPPSVSGVNGPGVSGKTDFAKHQEKTKRIGDRGEALVLALEQQRLVKAGFPKLAAKITHVSQDNDNAGYDILSFDADGTERPIEVKATTSSSLERGFYISSNEVEHAAALPNYHIYFVFSAMSKKPRIYPLKEPLLTGPGFQLRPVAYHATLTTRKST